MCSPAKQPAEAADGMDGADGLQLSQATARARAGHISTFKVSPSFHTCDILLPQVLAP